MNAYVVYNSKTDTVYKFYDNKEDALDFLNSINSFMGANNDNYDFKIAEQTVNFKNLNEAESCPFIRIEGYVSETIHEYTYSSDLYPDNIEYLNVVNYPEIDKDFELKVPKFTRFNYGLESDDSLHIKTYFTIWIENKTVELSWNLKRLINEIIKTNYAKLDRIKDFKHAFKDMLQVKYNKSYSDNMWKE